MQQLAIVLINSYVFTKNSHFMIGMLKFIDYYKFHRDKVT
jgi:hypothetical protein